jgi:hypothetical protein
VTGLQRCHGSVVGRHHLRGEHGLDFVARRDAVEEGEGGVDGDLACRAIRFLAARREEISNRRLGAVRHTSKGRGRE